MGRGMTVGRELGSLKLADAIGGMGAVWKFGVTGTVVELDRTALGLSDLIGELV